MTVKTFRPGKISDPEAGKSSGVDVTSLYKKKAKLVKLIYKVVVKEYYNQIDQ